MKIGALVPARIGSKRLPKKNIKVLGDKPLICWTIDVLLESGIFYDITVSTESDEIADIVRKYYSEREVNILKRPEELAQDDSPLKNVIIHYLENNPHLDWYGIFLPTYPFRRISRLKEAYNAILSHYPWRIRGVSQRQFCLLDFFYSTKKGLKHFFHGIPLYCRYGISSYEMNSVKYRNDFWAMYGLTCWERTYELAVSIEETIDIDTKEDFLMAEHFLKEKCFVTDILLEEYILNEKWLFIGPRNIDIELIKEKFLEQLKDDSNWLVVVKEDIMPVSFLIIYDGIPRDYFASEEAKNKLINQKVLATQNMKYFEKQYRHSSIFRFVPRETLFRLEYNRANVVIPWDRVVLEKELIELLYRDNNLKFIE